MGRKKIKDIKYSKSNIVKLPSGYGFTPQSSGLVSATEIYVFCNYNGSDSKGNRVLKVGKGSYKNLGEKMNSGHVNGGCYCNADQRFYMASYSGSYNYTVHCYSKNFKYLHKITLPNKFGSLGYDPVTKNFYACNGSRLYVYPYEAFHSSNNKNKKYTGKYGSHSIKSYAYLQDTGGYNGYAMVCRSHQLSSTKRSYIDVYRAADGKYMGSYYSTGELESVTVDSSGKLHVLYAGNKPRQLVHTSNNILKDLGVKTPTGNAPGHEAYAEAQGNKIVKEARKHNLEHGDKVWKETGMKADWCAMFVWCVFKWCGMQNLVPKYWIVPNTWTAKAQKLGCKVVWSKVSNSEAGVKKCGSIKNCKPGDIALYSGHINIVTASTKDGKSLKTIGGNQHGPAPNGHYTTNEVTEYNRSDMQWVLRPAYTDVAVDMDEEGMEGQGTLEVHPEKLFSSENFEYAEPLNFDRETEQEKQYKAQLDTIFANAGNFAAVTRDTERVVELLTMGAVNESPRPKTKVNGEVTGVSLPVGLDPVEAPFVEVTIGGYTFGVKSAAENFPNYIEGISVKRTNGSMNEYTINLVHQVAPGRNPNFIDELLAKNSYNKIKIKYGDANTDTIFTDENALLVGASINFDIASCNIKYSVKATSSVMSIASHKQNYSETTDKGSNVIFNMLNSAKSALGEAFPLMKDANYVAQNNLIPTDDSVVSIKGMNNVNDITYLKNIVATMKSEANPNSSYYLVLGDQDFKIHEVNANSSSYNASLYEVNINYPDTNQVFSFKDDVDFSWPLAYEYNGSVNTYNYDIDTSGTVQTYSSPFSSVYSNSEEQVAANNWWKQVTEFPVTATLTCRGLLSPLLLMTYIKVNCLYYGSRRLTGGVYIVTAQEDKLDSNGYRSTLSLTRVSGIDQHVTVDARVRT